ncbi:hypothetical protein ANN_17093 [Periplaneta americana]|uniref:Mos1 transposase HTH domain-containing protein n=1 Tax=Periplaneta americana TaxID=6978 RepID=A0ABQ8SRY6_PERAM|nr:hypothetical protein ANN_17093 [Periplaneta americana]
MDLREVGYDDRDWINLAQERDRWRAYCEHPKTILTKLEQRSWIKIEMARGHSAQECFQGLREACGDAALPYRTVARWVKAFREGLVAPVPKGR